MLEFHTEWNRRKPVEMVPATYPDWHVENAAKAGVSVVIDANQVLWATVSSLRSTFRSIYEGGESTVLEGSIVAVAEIFSLRRLFDRRKLDV